MLWLHAGFSAVLIATFLLRLPSFQASGTPVLQKYTRPNRIALQIRWFGWKGESFFEKRFHLRAQVNKNFVIFLKIGLAKNVNQNLNFNGYFSHYNLEQVISVNLAHWGPGAPGAQNLKFHQKWILLFYHEFLNEKISASYFEIVNMKATLSISVKLFVLRLHG